MNKNAIIQKALYDLWFKHYTKGQTGEQRSELVQDFIDEHLQGYDVSVVTAKHPAYYHKESDIRFKQFKVAEILADFIIRAEDDESGLTTSPQTQTNRDNKRDEHEVLTDFSDLFDDEVQAEDKPAGLLTEFNVFKHRSDLYVDFTDEAEPELTVDEFKAMIERVKANAEQYADEYSKKYRKDYKDTLRRIRRLDVDRVAICDECGEVYYKHDLRRKYCDLRPSCELNAKNRRDSERYYEQKSKKVKDRAETLHCIIEGANRKPY